MSAPFPGKRVARGLSQRDLARKAGIAYKTLQLIEAGKHDPRLSTIEKLAAALGEPVSALVGGPKGAPASDSAAAASARMAETDDWRIPFFDFVDAFRRRPSFDLAAEAPVPPLPHRLHALLAATVERLCSESGIPIPWWCAGVPPLDDPWFVSEVENLKAMALVESPVWHRKRNIFVLENFLDRA